MAASLQASQGVGERMTRLPLYLKIGELLHREIASGRWLPGERLPPESQLADDLNVAVGTLRKALASLEEEGLLERRQGSGTYVKRAPEGEAIYQFFRLELLAGGGVPSADVVALNSRRSAAVALQLADEPSEQWEVRRLRCLNNQPVAAEQISFSAAHAAQLSVEDLHESLYMHYREQFSFWIARVEDKVSCAVAPKWATELLQLPEHTVCGRVERRGFSNEDRAEEFSITWFDPARCQYIARWS